jgi:thiol-disulfide isomerase/thioredoxin
MLRWALLVLCALALPGCPRATRPAPALDLRDHLPDDAVGQVPFDREALGDKATLITFFATWCLPCLGQLGLVSQLQEEYGPRGLQVIAVGMDLDGRRVLGPFAQAYAANLPVLVADDALRTGQTPFGKVKEVPVSVILDRRGQVVVAWPGLAEADDVRRQVERALER